MCGICGEFNFKTEAPVDPYRLRQMAEAIAHRGPDDQGFFIQGPLGLGFRRLSIIDLEGGHQPMSDPEESVWVIFNGEIYNYLELRQELTSRGHLFRTKSDTEVLVHGYKEWGDELFNHLNGMFGVAIWDSLRRRLILARDAFGIKCVYYQVKNGELRFGSEIRSILAASTDGIGVDPVAVNLFLKYRFTPAPYTIFEGIQKLPSGVMLVAENGSIKTQRWYQYAPQITHPILTDDEAAEQLLAIYRRAVQRHLLSDVPVGLLLSGGIDSGLLLALMSSEGRSWPTYTVGYGSSFRDDELDDAEQTARLFSASHTSTRLTQDAFESSLRDIVSQLEEPVAASSIVPMYYVCKRAREDVKVALNGQGPDELFGGYRRHLGLYYARTWTQLPQWLRELVGGLIQQLPRNETMKRGAYSLGVRERMLLYERVLSLSPGDQIDGLFQQGLLPPNIDARLQECWAGFEKLTAELDHLGGFQFIEVRSTLPDELLMYADKMSMAHGLEVRVPYLDREIVEFAERLPARFKVRGRTQKWLHRKVCHKFLPRLIRNRKKRGFAVNVVDQWLRQSVGSAMDALLQSDDSLMYSMLRPEAVRRLLAEHRNGTNDHHKVLFSLVVFEQWLRVFRDRPNVSAARL